MLHILRHEIPYAVLLVISVETLNDKLLTISRQILRLSGLSYARNRMKMCVTIGSVEGIDGQLHHSDYHRANAFNEFFLVYSLMKILILHQFLPQAGVTLVPYPILT